jgi:hypothetical protein
LELRTGLVESALGSRAVLRTDASIQIGSGVQYDLVAKDRSNRVICQRGDSLYTAVNNELLQASVSDPADARAFRVDNRHAWSHLNLTKRQLSL